MEASVLTHIKKCEHFLHVVRLVRRPILGSDEVELITWELIQEWTNEERIAASLHRL